MNKQDVIQSHRKRMAARKSLINASEIARKELAPATLLNQWKIKQKNRLMNAKDNTAQFAKDNALIIGGAFGVGAVLAAGWRPLKKWVSGLREVDSEITFDDEE